MAGIEGQLTAQEISQIASQAASEAIQKFLQTQGQQTGVSSTETRMEETFTGERSQLESFDRSGVLFMNTKRGFDDHSEALSRQRDAAVAHLSALNNLVVTNLSEQQKVLSRISNNAVGFDNLINMQAGAHRDIAVDSEWVPGPGEETSEKRSEQPA